MYCLELLKGKQFELPIYYDVENNERQGSLSKTQLTNIVDRFCSIIQNAGYFVGYYSYTTWLLIVVFASNIGINLEFKCLIAVAVVLWLLINELISILENISDIGTPMPPFLLKILDIIKEKTGSSVNAGENALNTSDLKDPSTHQ